MAGTESRGNEGSAAVEEPAPNAEPSTAGATDRPMSHKVKRSECKAPSLRELKRLRVRMLSSDCVGCLEAVLRTRESEVCRSPRNASEGHSCGLAYTRPSASLEKAC